MKPRLAAVAALALALFCPVRSGAEPASTPGSSQKIPAEAAALIARGMKAFGDKNNDAAADAFAELVEKYPELPAGWMNLGLAEYRRKDYAAADRALSEAVARNIRFAPAWLLLGISRHENGDPDGALAALAQATWLEPGNPVARNHLAVAIGAKGWNAGAEAELRRALDLSPDYGQAHFNLALFYLKRTPPAHELALRHYRRALELGEAPDPLVEKKIKAAKP